MVVYSYVSQIWDKASLVLLENTAVTGGISGGVGTGIDVFICVSISIYVGVETKLPQVFSIPK